MVFTKQQREKLVELLQEANVKASQAESAYIRVRNDDNDNDDEDTGFVSYFELEWELCKRTVTQIEQWLIDGEDENL